jgi:hypothetical protein
MAKKLAGPDRTDKPAGTEIVMTVSLDIRPPVPAGGARDYSPNNRGFAMADHIKTA